MKQIIQHLKTGETILEEIPMPEVRPGHVLIRSMVSLVSAGTEKMIVEFSRANIISKARQQPHRVRQVLDKIKSDGLMPTLEAVFSRLDEPIPLGYCNAGIVVAVGDDVDEFKIGDRVASNGNHAEFVVVPKNLVAKIPASVSFEEAAFTPVGAISLQGIRLIQPQLGDTVIVMGLGLIGMLTAQLLKASGVHVIGTDISENKIEIAKQLGIKAFNASEDILLSAGIQDADSVIITASSKENNLINLAAKYCRKKGKIVLVGVTGIEINRDEFYKKELSFQVSCSYGPGRYDENYEQKGIDYPVAFVPYTAQRNFEAFLHALADGTVQVRPLISQKTELTNYAEVYDQLSAGNNLASLISYPENAAAINKISIPVHHVKASTVVCGIIGAGNYSKLKLLPVLKKINTKIKYIASANGLSAKLLAKKYNIPNITTDVEHIFNDEEVNLVIIATRHHLHADFICRGLQAGKHVFAEKPLAINREQLEAVVACRQNNINPFLFIGFNRRSSPLAVKAKRLIGNASDLNIVISVNAGSLPPDHWLTDKNVGGGRLIGEGCHFFDLASFFANSEIKSVYAVESGAISDKSWTANLNYENGAQATIHYFTNGNRSYPKETIELYSGGKIIVIDNFRSLKTYGIQTSNPLFKKQNKGHREELQEVIKAVEAGQNSMMRFESMVNTTKATFGAMQSISENRIISI